LAKLVDNLTAKARRTRQNIIQAARDILGRKGVGAVNVMEVCAAANVGRTSFYNYFDDIDGVIAAVAADAAIAMREQFDALHSDEPRGLARLEKCLLMLLVAGEEDPSLVMLLTSLAASEDTIRDLLREEIRQELKGAGLDGGETTDAQADFLTSVVLTLSRDITSGRTTTASIPTYVRMMMASTGMRRQR
jgi:AcrR family transcriptional regulator